MKQKNSLILKYGLLVIAFCALGTDAEANRRDRNSAQNKANAENFCRTEMAKGTLEECWAHPNRTCGRGGQDVAKFDIDPGDSWFACVKTKSQQAKDQAKEDAENFCKQFRASGGFCEVSEGGCSGRDRKELREFKGPGKNYRACGYSDYYLNTEWNKQKAEERCAQIRGSGKECKVDDSRGCGGGWEMEAKFDKNPGDSHFACVKTKAAQESDENQKKAELFCKQVNSAVGSLLRCEAQKNNCGGGFKNVKEFKGNGPNWAVCIDAKW